MGRYVRPFVLVSLCVLIGELSGCAVFQPQVHDPTFFKSDYASTYSGDLGKAMDAANAQGNAYFTAAAQYSGLRNYAALGAAVTGIAALMLGVVDNGSQDLRLSLAGASAATLGIAGYYDNRPRQLVYLAGAKAIACAVSAQRPLLISSTMQSSLTADAKELRTALTTFATDLAAKTPRPANGQIYTLEQGLTAQTAAQAALSDANKFQKAVDTAGVGLREKVKEIVAAVDEQVVKTDPDLQSIQKMIAGVGGAVPKPQATAAGDQAGLTENKNRSTAGGSLDWFDTDVINLINRTGTLRSDLADASPGKVDEVMVNCKVPEVAGALKMDPDETTHTVSSVPTTVVYSIRGGTLPISAGLSGDFPDKAFEVSQSTTGSTLQVSVKVAKEAKGHSATLNIADGSGAGPRHITIDVSASAKDNAPATTTQQTQDQNKPKPAKPTADTLTPQRVSLIRRVLKIQTGAGSTTLTSDDEAKMKEYATANMLAFDTKRSGQVYQAVLKTARTEAEGLTVSDDEKDLVMRSDVGMLRTACKLAAGDSANPIDKDLRDKIFDFEEQSTKLKHAIDGRLDDEVYSAMLQAKCTAPKT